jgi:protein ImuB
MLAPRAFLKLLYLDLSAHPPAAPIVKVKLAVQPARPRPLQGGLYEPAAPRPEKLEVILARLAGLVGEDHVGSAELLDTHRPGAFRMVRFDTGAPVATVAASPRRALAFRVFRPPFKIRVRLAAGEPAQISGHGTITAAAGPWRSSGDWWTTDPWDRDEWDVSVSDKLLRIYRERDEWFLQGTYD